GADGGPTREWMCWGSCRWRESMSRRSRSLATPRSRWSRGSPDRSFDPLPYPGGNVRSRAFASHPFGPNPTSTLVANAAEASEIRGAPFAGGPILPRALLGDPRWEFATSVNVGFGPRQGGGQEDGDILDARHHGCTSPSQPALRIVVPPRAMSDPKSA